ncbi:hypothetical protein [Winogradskyella sp.]|uniref:hypothetical protein n=1 Tax=Winogradskyella sp. TaxID=1883156 RepID=UPI003F697D7D
MDTKKTTTKNIIHEKEEILKIFSSAYKDNANHVNQNNYKIKESRLDGYIRFDVMYYEDDIVSFSGLWTHDKWNDCARAADRYYIFKKYRCKTIASKPNMFAASQSFIPKQFKTATEWGLNPFVSIQNIRKRKAINITRDRLKINHNLDCVILDGLRYTCINRSGSQNCWQNILTLRSCADELDAVLSKASSSAMVVKSTF